MKTFILAVDSLINTFCIADAGKEIIFTYQNKDSAELFDTVSENDMILGYFSEPSKQVKCVFSVAKKHGSNTLSLVKLLEVADGAALDDSVADEVETQTFIEIDNDTYQSIVAQLTLDDGTPGENTLLVNSDGFVTDLTVEQLVKQLNAMYASAPANGKSNAVRMFGFKYAESITASGVSPQKIVDLSNIDSDKYGNEIKKAMNIYYSIKNNEYGVSFANVSAATPEVFDYRSTAGTGINMIFYGTPGCGKSYHIEHNILGENKDTKAYTGDFLKENIIRTTFYQDYSYTDFVGQILPKIVKGDEGEKDTVEYIFNPGPFTLALIRAISNPAKKVALIIEEINRGNAPAIFGDIFQLLDRDENNVSEYGIVNVSMIDYLNNYTFTVDGAQKTYKFTEIKVPGNLYIYATMNTSDQNVYTLDTAFVRRWDREKIKNTFTNCNFKGKIVPGMNYSWQEFVEAINARIASHLEDLQVNEDKQIGAFFIKESLLSGSAEKFAYKVFDYLWNDVAKLERGIFFNDYNTLDALIAAYVDKGVAVFKPGIFKEKAAATIQSEAIDE